MNIIQVISWLVIAILVLQLPKNSHKVFWISLMLFLDPGGFFVGYLDGNIVWRIKYDDVFWGIMTLAYLIQKREYFVQLGDKELRKIFILLLIIATYFTTVYGYVVPLVEGYPDFKFFVQKNRQFFYAIPLFVYVNHFSFKSLPILYRYLVYFALFILGAYLITLVTGLEIVPLQSWDRFGEDDRISMISYGLIHWIMPLGLIFLALGSKIRVNYRKLVYVGMLFMIITIILTLTRREFLRVFFMLAIIPILVALVINSSILQKLPKYLIPAILVFFGLFLFFPSYVEFSQRLLVDLFYTLTTGADASGNVDYRVTGTGDLLIVKSIISQNWLFGIGYYPVQWSDIIEMQAMGDSMAFALDASSEVPIYGAFMRLGIVGLILPSFFYFTLIRYTYSAYSFLKGNNDLIRLYPVESSILLLLIYLIIAKFTVNAFSLFGDMYAGHMLIETIIIFTMLAGTKRRLMHLDTTQY